MVCKGGFYKGVSLCSLRECNIFVQRLFLVWMPAIFFLCVIHYPVDKGMIVVMMTRACTGY